LYRSESGKIKGVGGNQKRMAVETKRNRSGGDSGSKRGLSRGLDMLIIEEPKEIAKERISCSFRGKLARFSSLGGTLNCTSEIRRGRVMGC